MLDDFYQGVNPYTGLPETEEERRKRLGLPALGDVVASTEIKTYGDGTSEQITKQTMPAPAAGPVDPETFNRMIQAESGGQQFNRQGGVLTSPRGALGVGQVMPATAAQPGYGVPSIFDLAQQRGIAVPSRDPAGAAQLLANEQLNREFAQNYATAMTQRFGQQGGVAAYNAGPGRVERNMAVNAGQINPQQLPGETQGYLDRVLGGVKRGAQAVVNAVIPSAQASVLTPEQIRQQALAQRQQQSQPPRANIARPSLATPGILPDQTAPALGQGLRMPGMAVPQAQPSTTGIDLYQQNQDNPQELFRMRGDTNLPSFIRERAGNRAYELMDAERKRKEGEAQAQALAAAAAGGDRKAGLTMARELQNQEGSYLKMILLSYISPELAGEEAVKLGIGNKWQTAYDADGNAGLVEVNMRGRPVRGILADGSDMSKTDLIRYAAGGNREYDVVGGTYVNDTTGEVGRVYANKKNPNDQFVQTATGRKPLTGFRPQGQSGTLDMQRVQQIQRQNIELAGDWAKLQMRVQGAAPEAANRFIGEFNAKHGTSFGLQSVGGSAPQIDLTTGRMTTTPATAPAQVPAAPPGAVAPTPLPPAAAPAAAPAPAPVVPKPTAAQPAPAVTPTAGKTPAQIEAQAEAAKTGAVTEARETAEDLAKVKASQGKAERQADYLITKMDELVKHPGFETSVGAQGASYLFGMLDKPLPPQLGGGPARDWQNRAREVIGGGFVQAIEALKGFGALSDAEGKSAAAAIQRLGYMDPKTNLPVVTATEAEFRSAVKDFQEVIKRNIDGNRAKLGQQPKYGTPPESEQNRSSSALTPADRARQELERRRRGQ